MILQFIYLAIVLFAVTTTNSSTSAQYDSRRIMGGQEAPPGIAPHQVSIRLMTQHFCGGAILNNRFIITAAHCFDIPTVKQYGISYISVKVGSNSLSRGGYVYNVNSIIVHEYKSQSTNLLYVQKNDIALVKTMNFIQFNNFVRPVNLPSRNTPAGVQVFMSGWGIQDYQGTVPDKLQMYYSTILDLNVCAQHVNNPVYESHICEFNREATVNKGDSGGALVANGEVVGIASFGDLVHMYTTPKVYTRVYYFLDWIQQKIMENSFD